MAALSAAEAPSGVVVSRALPLERPEPLHIIGPGELSSPMSPPKWLVPGLRIAAGAPTLIAGYGYSGKSIALQSLALSVASGCKLWERYDVRRGAVLHLDYEQGARITVGRYQRMAHALGIDLGDVPELEVGILPSVGLDEAMLLRVCEGRALVLIDSWRAAFPKVDENSSEVRGTFDGQTKASERTGCVLVDLHHARKPQQNGGGAKFTIRGSSGFFDGCQTVYVFDGERVGSPRITLEKDRIGGQEMPAFSLAIEDVDQNRGLRVVAHVDESTPHAGPNERFEGIVEAVLGILGEHRAGLSASEMSERLERRKASVVAACQSLEAAGKVLRLGAGNSPTSRYVRKDCVVNGAPL